MKSFNMLLLFGLGLGLVEAAPPPFESPPLKHATSWIGNTYAGAQKWVQQDIHAMTVTADGNVTLQAATLALAPLEAWRASYFSGSELADPNISGDTADPDGDGIPNLLEYALNGNPRVANASIRPQPSILADHLTLNYTRRKAATDVTYDLQVSSELTGGWTPAGIVEQVLLDDGGLQTVRASDPAWVSANARRFLKLNVGKQ
jgi:hypothetical protein